jgi:hypothetical protein
MTQFSKVAGSVALTTALAFAPFAASAHTNANIQGSTGVVTTPSGFVALIGANVTAVSGSMLTVALNIGNTLTNWVVNVNATTHTISGGTDTTGTSTAKVSVGDKVNILGNITATSTNTITASRIKDTSKPVVAATTTVTVKGDKDAYDNKGEGKKGNKGLHLGEIFGHINFGFGKDN